MWKQEGFSLMVGISFHGTQSLLIPFCGTCTPGLAGSGHLQAKPPGSCFSVLMQIRLLPAYSSFGPKPAMQTQEFKYHQFGEGMVVFVFNYDQLWVVFLCLLAPDSSKHNQITLSNYMGRCVWGGGVHTNIRTRNMPLK